MRNFPFVCFSLRIHCSCINSKLWGLFYSQVFKTTNEFDDDDDDGDYDNNNNNNNNLNNKFINNPLTKKM